MHLFRIQRPIQYYIQKKQIQMESAITITIETITIVMIRPIGVPHHRTVKPHIQIEDYIKRHQQRRRLQPALQQRQRQLPSILIIIGKRKSLRQPLTTSRNEK